MNPMRLIVGYRPTLYLVSIYGIVRILFGGVIVVPFLPTTTYSFGAVSFALIPVIYIYLSYMITFRTSHIAHAQQ